MDTVTSYIYSYQKKLVYNTFTAKKIKKAYKQFLLNRMTSIFNLMGTRRAIGCIREHVKNDTKDK